MSVDDDTVLHRGQHTFSKMPALPTGAWKNADIAASAGIVASKCQQQYSMPVELFGPTTAITALTKHIYLVYGATGTIQAFKAWLTTVATGADRTVDVDLQKSTGGGAFATILSATIHFTNGSTALSASSGSLSSASVVAGDILRAVVTVAGAAGNQALGLGIALITDEDPV